MKKKIIFSLCAIVMVALVFLPSLEAVNKKSNIEKREEIRLLVENMKAEIAAKGGWLMKNSWGTGWGENGFMRIAYGCNNVGYSANYVVY